jgi:ribosomal protein S27E
MGHGKKRVIDDTQKEISERPSLKHTSHKLVSIAKRKRVIFPKFLKVACDICITKTMVEKNDEVVTCRNCDRNLKVE